MKIIKVINNNTVCTLDKKGREQIASGKGIGFGKSVGTRSTRRRCRRSI
ncbi:MAG: CAT RNA binding domain-containing protein [Ruminococcus sp.]